MGISFGLNVIIGLISFGLDAYVGLIFFGRVFYSLTASLLVTSSLKPPIGEASADQQDDTHRIVRFRYGPGRYHFVFALYNNDAPTICICICHSVLMHGGVLLLDA